MGRKVEFSKKYVLSSKKCIDNVPIECFWRTLKCEMYKLNNYVLQ